MRVFITGTDTNIGKTLVSSWLCIHTGYSYFKPIQTGSVENTDTHTLFNLTKSKIHKENYIFPDPLSPHLAARNVGATIDISNIRLPQTSNLIVEGAGGVLVPINHKYFIVDLIQHFNIPVIIVASTKLGTINHTLLTIEMLRARQINILGVILSGAENTDNMHSIRYYGKISILAELPYIQDICYQALKDIPLSRDLKKIFECENEFSKT